MSSQSTGDARFRLRPATFSSPPSSPIPSASRSPSPTTSPPPSPHTPIAPRLTPADAVFQYSSRPLVPITIPVPQVDYSRPSSPVPSPALLSSDSGTNAHASVAFQYSSRPLEPICIPVLAHVKAEAGASLSEPPASPGLGGSGAPPQASPPRLSRQAKGKWRETKNSPSHTADPAQHPPQSYSPNGQASGDNATQNEGVENNNGNDKGNLQGEDQAEGDTHERADVPFAHLPPALRPVRPALVPPPALPTPLPNLNASTRPSDTPRASKATQQTLSLSQDQQRAQIDALFAKIPPALRPYRPTALKTPPPLPKGYIPPSPSPPRSPTPSTNSNPTPSLSQAPIHSEGGDEAKSSVGKGLLTLVSLTMWPVRNGAKPRTGVATRSQVLKAKGGVLPSAAAQLVIAQKGVNVAKEVGSGHGGTKRKRTESVSATAAGTANKDKKAQRSAKAELTERADKAENDTNVDGKTKTRGDVAEPLSAAKSIRPAKRARLAAPHGSAKAPAKAMIRLPPRVTRASARMQATTDPSTSKAELDENESGVGGDNGEFQFIVQSG
ncbi:hypothetical protein EYR40_009162 [Pleurotus pulmonarius]|nr:hypothetical protein EYR40_009162 [Pleurotus pulmonarius]